MTRPPTLVGNKVKLRPKRLQDAASDYSWRTDTELCRLDAAAPVLGSFGEYLRSYAEELRYPGPSARFAIETMDGRYIGNCSYFNVDKTNRQAEIGIMVGDRAYWDQGYGADAVLTLVNHIHSQTGLERVYLRTLSWNLRAQKCFRKCGFVPCGQLIRADHDFIIMELRRSAEPQKKAKQD